MTPRAKTLLAACGLYCGACYHYRASFYNADSLSKAATRRGRDAAGFTCQGCRSKQLYIHPGCAHCEIRSCADARGILHCGACAGFPCDRIAAFQNDGRVHHRDILLELERLQAKGPGQWLAEQETRWTCGCGEPYGWYEERCRRCGAPLPSYGPDPTLA